MPEADDFHDLIRRTRSGDEVAAAEFVAQFEPYILRIVRLRMRQRADYERLRHELASGDVCQSIFKSLFVRLRHGRFALSEPKDVQKLLNSMIRFKIATHARRHAVTFRELLGGEFLPDLTDPGPEAERIVEDHDLSEAILKMFSVDELEILNRRLDEQTWSQIALELGGSAQALRKKLERAFQRVREDLGMKGVRSD
jgi:DNA-directed RNA polymerase specialized sigma24 family protein